MTDNQGPAMTVCGMPLETSEGDECAQPIAALVVIKVFAPEGERGVRYMVRATDGLSDVEACGMAYLAGVRLLDGQSFTGDG